MSWSLDSTKAYEVMGIMQRNFGDRQSNVHDVVHDITQWPVVRGHFNIDDQLHFVRHSSVGTSLAKV
jgi:hypothetical protein